MREEGRCRRLVAAIVVTVVGRGGRHCSPQRRQLPVQDGRQVLEGTLGVVDEAPGLGPALARVVARGGCGERVLVLLERRDYLAKVEARVGRDRVGQGEAGVADGLHLVGHLGARGGGERAGDALALARRQRLVRCSATLERLFLLVLRRLAQVRVARTRAFGREKEQ